MSRPLEVVTVTPNPAVDWTLTVPGFAAGAVNRVEEVWMCEVTVGELA